MKEATAIVADISREALHVPFNASFEAVSLNGFDISWLGGNTAARVVGPVD